MRKIIDDIGGILMEEMEKLKIENEHIKIHNKKLENENTCLKNKNRFLANQLKEINDYCEKTLKESIL